MQDQKNRSGFILKGISSITYYFTTLVPMSFQQSRDILIVKNDNKYGWITSKREIKDASHGIDT